MMNNRHLISIGMPVFNCESTVAYSIASILNQTFEEWELIVYDDGSRDGTVAVARQFSDPRIHVVEGGQNGGLPACLNRIIGQCGSEYFARMDGDDIAYPNRFQDQFDFLQSHADVDLVAGSMIVFRNDGSALGVRRGVEAHEEICANPWAGIPMAHPTWMGRTDWFRRNPYNPDLVRMEDWELLFRTYRDSKFANLPEIVLGYREDSLNLRKILVARKHKCAVMLQKAWVDRSPWHAAAGIGGQIARSLVDITAIGLNLNYLLLKHRAPPVLSNEIVVWHDVFEKTRGKALEQMAQQAVSN
jgi:glycosyltransferase involved in cell wall biosynthesis